MTPSFDHLDLIETPIFVLRPNAAGEPVYAAFNRFARGVAQRPLSDFLNRTAKEVYLDAYGRTAFERHREVMQSGVPMEYELELPLAGRTVQVQTHLAPFKDDEGTVRFLYGTSRNITAEREAMERRVDLETMLSDMEQYVALAAHDLRAPMRNMALLADMLKEDFEDRGDGKLELIDMMEEVAQKSMGLITDVLSQAQSMRPGEAAQRFNFAALCQDIKDILDPRVTHCLQVAGTEVHADRTAMQIALRNIMENAFKHGAKDRLTLTATVQPAELPGMLQVSLSDDGQGFSEAALKFLNGGRFGVDSGYGLHGVKRLLMARGGEITAKSLPDQQGSKVSFTLPGEWIGKTRSLGHLPQPKGPLAAHVAPEFHSLR